MTEFTLPELGEEANEAEVIRLLISEGDVIEAGQNVMEVESDKAAVALPCPHAGKVTKVHVKEGDVVSSGQALLSIEAVKGEKEEAAPEKAPAPAEAGNGKKRPEGDGKPAGKRERRKQKPARAERPEQAEAEGPSTEKEGAEAAPAEKEAPAAGPATRRLARQLGVDLKEVEGGGPEGRVTREDVRAASERKEGPLTAPPLPDFGRWGPVERQRPNAVGRATAERVSLSWRLIPHVTQHEWADVTDLEEARERFEHGRPDGQPKVTLTVLAIHAAVAALKAFPQFNSSFDAARGDLIVKQYYHIGVAVDTERGLLVPVIRDADQKSVVELAAELAESAEKARARSLPKERLQGGTFTVSNLGGIGGIAFTPIINYPEVAILGLARARWLRVPRSRHDDGENRLILPLALSYDHRVINGADGARFLAKVAELLSGAFTLLAEA